MIMPAKSLEELNNDIDRLDLVAYGQTRNYLDGAVSKLSPYISRGFITLPYLKDRILSRVSLPDAKSFIYELCWREYFQRIWFAQGDKIFTDFKNKQTPVAHYNLPQALVEATTGIHVIDEQLQSLYSSGYMHNHARMYIASLTCNIARAHWLVPSRWLYYHLLDGDLASNALSWQWVAGTFSTKKYYFNQNNVNTYSRTAQQHTFMDFSYEEIMKMNTPTALQETAELTLKTILPNPTSLSLDFTKPLFLYTSYTLDPQWRTHTNANRLLVLEPSHFNSFPVSNKVLNFILSLAEKINDLQVYVGEVTNLPGLEEFPEIISKQHPTTQHFPGHKDEPTWMFPEVPEPRGSFTGFWKGCEKVLIRNTPL